MKVKERNVNLKRKKKKKRNAMYQIKKEKNN